MTPINPSLSITEVRLRVVLAIREFNSRIPNPEDLIFLSMPLKDTASSTLRIERMDGRYGYRISDVRKFLAIVLELRSAYRFWDFMEEVNDERDYSWFRETQPPWATL